MESASSGTSFLTEIYKGFSKFIKDKYFLMNFQIFSITIIYMSKSASEAPILMSRRFFRHPYQWPESTMAALAAMAISLIWPLWQY